MGNAACALAAVEAFAGVADGPVSAGPASAGPTSAGPVSAGPLSAGPASAGTGRAPRRGSGPGGVREGQLAGRLEVIRHSPTMIIDAAHNPAGMAATVAAIEESFSFARPVQHVRCQRRQGRAGHVRPSWSPCSPTSW